MVLPYLVDVMVTSTKGNNRIGGSYNKQPNITNSNEIPNKFPNTTLDLFFFLPTAVITCKWEMFTSIPSRVRGGGEIKMTNNSLSVCRIFQRET